MAAGYKETNENTRELAQSYAAGHADSRRFMALYRAYLRGASDAAGCDEAAERADSLKIALAAMAFALVSWTVMMILVFK